MIQLTALLDLLHGTVDEWRKVPYSELHLVDRPTAMLLIALLAGVTALSLLARSTLLRAPERQHMALPALLPSMRGSRAAALRHTALVLFLAGIPWFAVALADPRTSLRREDASYLGRRIALLVDSSTSMAMKFEAAQLRPQSSPAFFTAVAAAERFMRQRMSGQYRDLVALIQFGNEAYVVTPFTTDYENVILSLTLISNPREWGRFGDWGTTIFEGLEEGTALFEAFDFVNASGNLMLIFTDGRDDQVLVRGQHLDRLMAEARRNQIPIYMIRTAWNMKQGAIKQDAIWQAAVERTGGRFYAAPDEAAILRALDEIDRLGAGRIDVRRYSVEEPRFAGYALLAVGLWVVAGALKFAVPYFTAFP